MKTLVSYIPEVRAELEKLVTYQVFRFKAPSPSNFKTSVGVLDEILLLGGRTGNEEFSLSEFYLAFLIAKSGYQRFCEYGSFWEALSNRLGRDSEEYGDTWRKRSIEGQTSRTMARIRDYRDKLKYGKPDVSEMFLKTCGNLCICIVRLLHPAYQMEDVLTK